MFYYYKTNYIDISHAGANKLSLVKHVFSKVDRAGAQQACLRWATMGEGRLVSWYHAVSTMTDRRIAFTKVARGSPLACHVEFEILCFNHCVPSQILLAMRDYMRVLFILYGNLWYWLWVIHQLYIHYEDDRVYRVYFFVHVYIYSML